MADSDPAPEELEVRVTGEGIQPGTLRSREIGEIIRAFEDMVAAKVASQVPELRSDEIVVGLYSIEAGSLRLKFRSPVMTAVLPAYVALAAAVTTADFREVPNASLRAMREIVAFASRHECAVQLWAPGASRASAEVSAATVVPEALLAEGETTLVGRVLRVGGRSPRAMVETIQGETVFCDVSREVAQSLGHRLYEWVELSGTAEWNPDDWSVESFRVASAQTAASTAPRVTLRELARVVGEVFADIGDVTGYVRRLRQGAEAD